MELSGTAQLPRPAGRICYHHRIYRQSLEYPQEAAAKAMTMHTITWDGRLETGHAVIDSHHENLVHLFNQVVSIANHRAGKLVCNRVLDKLIRHTKEHFAFEELLMTQYRYPERAEHMAEHETLIRRALAYRLDPGSSESRMPLIELGRDWLTLHMLNSDKRLTGFLATVVPPGSRIELPERANVPAGKSRKRPRT